MGLVGYKGNLQFKLISEYSIEHLSNHKAVRRVSILEIYILYRELLYIVPGRPAAGAPIFDLL